MSARSRIASRPAGTPSGHRRAPEARQEPARNRRVPAVARRLGVASGMTGTAGDLALGTWGTTPLELTAAYAALANGGVPVVRYVVCEVKDNEGAVAYARAERPQGAPVIDPRHLRDMRRMLAAVVRGGTGRAADPGRGWAAGKTGTTADHRDAWFVGLTDRVAAGVWLGNASGAPTGGLTGGGPPARVWRAVVAEAGRGA